MRKIKFRGKTVCDTWFYGDLRLFMPDQAKIYNEQVLLGFEATKGFGMEVYLKTVGQYSGAKDKNGTEIYEGDILKCRDSYDENNYITSVGVDGVYNIEVRGCDYDLTSLIYAIDNDDIIECEVIGNIYDNPEMKEEK